MHKPNLVNNPQALSFTIILLSIFSISGYAQKITISGYVKDSDTKESLIGATVFEAKLKKGSTANEYGFYSLTLPDNDTLNVVFSYTGFFQVSELIFLMEGMA